MKQTFYLLLLCPLLWSACQGTKTISRDTTDTADDSTSAPLFVNSGSLFSILDQAEAEGKLVFVDIYTTWCLPCRLMDEEVFTDREIQDYLNKHFISYKVDAEKDNGPNIAAIYEVQVYPTLLFMDGQGRVVLRKDGSAMQTEFLKLAQEAVEKAQSAP